MFGGPSWWRRRRPPRKRWRRRSWEPSAWEVRGGEVCRTVYGGQYDSLRDNVRRLHADMERWMVSEGYGKVLARPGLSLVHRELCIVALLAVTGWGSQLYSHLRGALNAGAEEAEVEEALDLALAMADEGVATSARRTWERVCGRRGGREEDGGDPKEAG